MRISQDGVVLRYSYMDRSVMVYGERPPIYSIDLIGVKLTQLNPMEIWSSLGHIFHLPLTCIYSLQLVFLPHARFVAYSLVP